MMGCTDRHCRYLMRLLAPNTLLYSEMIVTGALLHGDAEYHLRHSDDSPCAIQLGGSNPSELAASAKLVEAAGYQEVNLNCGCPSDRVQMGGIGACLMGSADLVADCYRAMAEEVQIPVTIKSRIGIDKHDSYEFFSGFISTIYAAGCRAFSVHARSAWLDGLSPKENREIPPLHYDYVTRIKADFPDAVFVLNGGIANLADALALLQAHDGIMLGRAPYASPYLLAELEQAVYGIAPPTRDEVFDAYRAYVESELSEGTALKHMAKHLFGLYAGVSGARAFRRHLSTTMNVQTAGLEVLDAARDNISRAA